ncbi:MAG: hypothetical protein IJ233_11730 [Pyramidobacter sp.]|nr:hypothetical protein [Pyramidobacter sp.]
MPENIITSDSAIIYVDSVNRTYFKNSTYGRSVMKDDLLSMDMIEEYHAIVKAWGDNAYRQGLQA